MHALSACRYDFQCLEQWGPKCDITSASTTGTVFSHVLCFLLVFRFLLPSSRPLVLLPFTDCVRSFFWCHVMSVFFIRSNWCSFLTFCSWFASRHVFNCFSLKSFFGGFCLKHIWAPRHSNTLTQSHTLDSSLYSSANSIENLKCFKTTWFVEFWRLLLLLWVWYDQSLKALKSNIEFLKCFGITE